jgi:SWI/SNF-related matrix-associated actin-dependent regulator of chromatin subfamily A3
MGGILADVMGLGKTLSMISAIVSSLPQATEYATAGHQNFSSPSWRCRSRATLVIATSMRESFFIFPFPLSPVLILTFCRGLGCLEEGSVRVSVSRTRRSSMLTNIHSRVRPGALRICIFHGSSRPKSTEGVIDYDLVLTTYATLSGDSRGSRVLQGIEWYRVVLDEGKSIHLY